MEYSLCKKPRPGRRAASYARFSSHNQRSESIEIQHDNNLAYCAIEDLDVVAIYSDEARSGRGLPAHGRRCKGGAVRLRGHI